MAGIGTVGGRHGDGCWGRGPGQIVGSLGGDLPAMGPWGRGCLGRGRGSLRAALQGNGWRDGMMELGDKI